MGVDGFPANLVFAGVLGAVGVGEGMEVALGVALTVTGGVSPPSSAVQLNESGKVTSAKRINAVFIFIFNGYKRRKLLIS